MLVGVFAGVPVLVGVFVIVGVCVVVVVGVLVLVFVIVGVFVFVTVGVIVLVGVTVGVIVWQQPTKTNTQFVPTVIPPYNLFAQNCIIVLGSKIPWIKLSAQS